MVGYIRKNSKKVKVYESSLYHVILTKTKGTELKKVVWRTSYRRGRTRVGL